MPAVVMLAPSRIAGESRLLADATLSYAATFRSGCIAPSPISGQSAALHRTIVPPPISGFGYPSGRNHRMVYGLDSIAI
jgi:hypothetical protein